MFSKLITTAAVVMVVAVGSAAAGTTPQGLRADGLRLQAMADRYQQLRGTTPDGITADGRRLQAIARAYQSPPVVSASGGTGFNWGDAGIGVAGGFVLLVCSGIAVLFARRLRRAKLAL